MCELKMDYKMFKNIGDNGNKKNVCPNDRQLALRAKLLTGWSSTTRREPLKLEEQAAIISVIRRNEEFDKIERHRVWRLVERVEKIKEYAENEGANTCTSCTQPYRRLLLRTMKCDDCGKPICTQCGLNVPIRYFTVAKARDIWLCRLCCETREMWKKTGAWFYKSLPCVPTTDEAEVPTIQKKQSELVSTADMYSNSNILPLPKSKDKMNVSVIPKISIKKLTIHANDSSSSEDEDNLLKKIQHHCNEIDQLKLNPYGNGNIGLSTSTVRGNSLTQCQNNDNSDVCITIHALDSYNDNTKVDGMYGLKCTSIDNHINSDIASSAVDWSRRRSSITSTDTISDSSSLISINQNCSSQGLSRDLMLGWLEISINYRETHHTLDTTVVRARDLRCMDNMGSIDPYCKVNIIAADNTLKFLRWQRSRTLHNTRNPEFNESMYFVGMEPEEITKCFLYVIVYDEDVYGHDYLGSAKISLSTLGNDNQCRVLAPLNDEDELSKKCDQFQNTPYGKILIALCYDTKKRMLLVNIKECSNLIAMDNNGTSDPFIKLQMKPGVHGNRKYKTSIKWRTLNPIYNEHFQFEASPQDFNKQCLILTAWDKDLGKRNDFLGSLIIGYNSKGERLQQWLDCIRLPDQFHEKWHNFSGNNPLH